MAEKPDAMSNDCILTLYKNTLNNLSSGDYALQLFLPDDDTDIAERAQALGQWAHGFLIGFGAAGIDPQTQFSSDNAGALRDLAQIAQVTSADGDHLDNGGHLSAADDSQEADYFELTEYVRIVALTFYAEYSAVDSERPLTH